VFDSDEVFELAFTAIANGLHGGADVFYPFAVEQAEGPDRGAEDLGWKRDFWRGR